MLVSALLGGAGVRAIEMLISWRKESSASKVAEKTAEIAEENAKIAHQKELSEMEARLRRELREENETLRKRLGETGKHAVVVADTDVVPPDDAVIVQESPSQELHRLRVELEHERSTNRMLASTHTIMARRIADLEVELEWVRKKALPAPSPPAPPGRSGP